LEEKKSLAPACNGTAVPRFYSLKPGYCAPTALFQRGGDDDDDDDDNNNNNKFKIIIKIMNYKINNTNNSMEQNSSCEANR
jgi:hypothetical protein